MCVIKAEDLAAEEKAAYESYMRAALEEARMCIESDDVPVGAVAVFENEIIGRGRNAREKRRSPLWHAEMQACEEAASRLGRWNLSGVLLVATKEPCVMCAGLLVQSRISTCVFAVPDKKGGGCGGNMQIACNPELNHRARLVSGVLESECLELLRGFFQKKRK
ncbi:MAG TPA: nucleoside deaminase [Candidatus Wallbacteria bacterium]|nr:nucleoside deaminase [Candidatus Wallbacteria bacterium]